MKKILKEFKKFPDHFWLDIILSEYKNTIHGTIGFNAKSIENSFNKFCQKSKGSLYFKPELIHTYIVKLLADGYIEPINDSYKITNKGLAFLLFDFGYLALAKKTKKERLRFDFEYFKIGYDTVASTIAIILSIIAIYISTKQ